MAESNIVREARRRQILENAESRLRKITGKSNLDETKDNSLQVKSNSLKAVPNVEEYDVRNGTANVYSNTNLHHTRFHENEYEISNDTISSMNISFTEQLSKKKSLLHILLFNRISLILLAALVNVLLILELNNLFGQAVIPYLVLMLARLSVCDKLQDMQEGSLLYTALLLCNIQHSVVNRVKTFFAFFSLVFRDFGLYMFSFVLMHYIAMCYLGYNVTVLRNT